MKKHILAIIASFLMFFSTQGIAAKAAPVQEEQAIECSGLVFATGKVNKGYSNQFENINRVCGKVVPICELRTSGGLENISETLPSQTADIALAQVDTYNGFKGKDPNIARLQTFGQLNFNYMHIFVNKNGLPKAEVGAMGKLKGLFTSGDSAPAKITKYSQLKGMKVGVVGTAVELVRKLDSLHVMRFDIIETSDEKIETLLANGEVAAVFSMSSWQHPVTKGKNSNSILGLADYDSGVNQMADFEVRTLNYRSIAAFNVDSLAVPNMLFTRPFKGEKASMVATLQSCIDKNITTFQEGRFEPSWTEVTKFNDPRNVPKFDGKKTGK